MIKKFSTSYGQLRIYSRELQKPRGYIMVVPGYGESLSHNRALVDILAELGYNAFTFNQPTKKATSTSAILNRRKSIMLEALANGVPAGKKVYAVAHSLGSATALLAIREAPDRFIGALLMQPPGLTGAQSFSELVGHTSKKVMRNNFSTVKDRHLYRRKHPKRRALSVTTRQLIRSQLSSSYMIAKNPLLALKEASAAMQYDITDDIMAVQDLGVPIQIVQAPKDELFVSTNRNYKLVAERAVSYLSIADSDAPHDTFWMHPRRTAEIIDAIVASCDGKAS